MMRVSVKIKREQLDYALSTLREVAKSQRRYSLFRRFVTLIADSWWAETFWKQGARRGHPLWAPLSDRYLKWKVRHGKSDMALILTGHLQGSHGILSETDTTLTWGTNIPYAEYHQNPSIPGRPPKREIVFITEDDKTELGEFCKTFLRTMLERFP